MKRLLALRQVMTPFPYSIDVESPVDEAQRFMREHRIRHLPVMGQGELLGVVSDRDIKLALGPDFAYPNARELKVRDVFVPDSYVVELTTPLQDVLQHMAEHRLGSAVVTRGGKLAGVFTATDACRAFAEYLRDQASDPPDAVA